MEAKIAENIRFFRKQQGLVQEQLAEAMGVTVSAVSKWEQGIATPDINMIMGLADFFQISVDVLLGYEIQNRSIEKCVDRMKELCHQRDMESLRDETEKALQKYPNSFQVVKQGITAYKLLGTEKKDKKAFCRALELCRKLLTLSAGTSEKDKLTEFEIQSEIGHILLLLEKPGEALVQLKKYNIGGCNDGAIGIAYMAEEKYEEALEYSSKAFAVTIAQLFNISWSYINSYSGLGKPSMALEFASWVHSTVNGVKTAGKVSYVNREDALLLAGCACISASMGKKKEMKEYLRLARAEAEEFDATPAEKQENIKFYKREGRAIEGDFMGKTCLEAIADIIQIQGDGEKELLMEIWEALGDENASRSENNNLSMEEIGELEK